MVSVTIGGSTPDALLEVDVGTRTGDLGQTTIVIGSTTSNKNTFGSGDKVVVSRPNNADWNGYVVGRPENTELGTLEVKAMDTRYELKNLDVHRVFYDMDRGDVVKDAVTKQAEGLGEIRIHDGDSLTGWSSDTPIFELAGLSTKQIHERGSDLLFAGIREGSTGSFTVTFSNVPSEAIPGDGQILKLVTRMLVNDPGNQVTGEIELRDNSGNQYVWDVEYLGTDFNEYELLAEEAESDGDVGSNGSLEYRFELSGEVADNIGIVIDSASTFPFSLTSRSSSDLTVTNVETTGTSITRRVDADALQLIQDLETEEGYTSWLDSNEDLHFKQAGGESTSKQIVRGTTTVTDAKFNTNYDTIDNKVTVKGNPAKDVQVTLRDPGSVAFYGVAPRSEPLIDEQLQTNDEAEDRGRGYLEQNAWNDTVSEFEIADTSYQAVKKGDSIYVKWPPQNLDGDFIVTEKQVDSAGMVTLSVGVRV